MNTATKLLMITIMGLLPLAACDCGSEPQDPPRIDGDGGVIFNPEGDVVIVQPTEDGGIDAPDAAIPDGQVGITSITPANGPLGGLNRVAIAGFGFIADAELQQIFFGTEAGIAPILLPNGDMGVTVPPGINPGAVDVRITNPLGEAISENGYAYFSPVTVSDLDPAVGPESGGTFVTLTGNGFSDEMVVLIDGRRVVDLQVQSETQATFMTPPGNPGRQDVLVSDPFGASFLRLGFVYEGELRIDSVRPFAIEPNADPRFQVFGSGYGDDVSATVSGDATENTNRIDQGRLQTAVQTTITTGLKNLTVTSGAQSASLNGALLILGAPTTTISITGVVPSTGDIAGGDTVGIAGSQFNDVTSVTVGGEEAAFTRLSSRALEIVTPPGPVGPAVITVTTALGSASFNGFSYTNGLFLESIDPPSGPAAGGTQVTLTGRGFVAGMNVSFGGVAGTNLTVTDANTATITTPQGSAGLVDVRIESGASQTVLDDGYRFEGGLRLLSVLPQRGSMSGGTFATLVGEGFSLRQTPSVTFGGQSATEVEVVSDSIITCKTPPNNPGLYSVTASFGDDDAVAANIYTYFDPTFLLGGTRGGDIDGAVYVTLIDSFTRLPIPDLPVFLGTEGQTPYVTTTNVLGQATLSGPDIFGPQTVTAAGDGYEYATLVDINASEITLYLQPIGGGPPAPPQAGFQVCGNGEIEFGEECDDQMQCDDGSLCNEWMCETNDNCLDGYECTVDPEVNERRCKKLECSDGSPCFEYRCTSDESCEEDHVCTPTDEGFNVCKPSFCEGSDTPCYLERCDPAFEDACDVGFQCLDQGGTDFRCMPIINPECPTGARCLVDEGNSCSEGLCERAQDCDEDQGLCLTRYTDGCTGAPAHGALHCAADDLLCNQMRQCRPACEVEITMRGRVFGFAKEFFDPELFREGNKIALAIVTTTARNEFSGTPDPCQFNVVFQEGDEYFIARSRTGPLAVVALAGIFDTDTGEFALRQMGIRRPAFPAPFTHLEEQDIELTVPLDKTIQLSLPDAPVGGELNGLNPTITRVIPYLKFGSDGTFFYNQAISTDRNHELETMPDLPGESFTFFAGAYTTNGQGLVTEQGTASMVEGDPFVTGFGTNWDETDFFGRPLVEGAVFFVESIDGRRFATTVTTAIDATRIQLAKRPPFGGNAMVYHIGNPGFPQSEVLQEGTGDLTVGGITINPVLGLPEPISPAKNGVLLNRELTWKAAPGQEPTFHIMNVYEPFNFEVLWTFYVDGQRTKVPVPRFPYQLIEPMVEVAPLDVPVGGMVWQHTAMFLPGFDYNNFSYVDFGRRARRSWTTDVTFFVNGGD